MLGEPRTRKDYSVDCTEITNPKLSARIVTVQVHDNFKLTGEKIALQSIKRIFAKIKVEKPDLYSLVGSAGMTCCRFIRGSKTNISNHSWGTAVDFLIDGVLDNMGDGYTLAGLLALYPYFHAEGWYWGVGFTREDGMHFEVAKETAEQWYGVNALTNLSLVTTDAHLTLKQGDQGQEVKTLQALLGLTQDGAFGAQTTAAVIKFQKKYSLPADGIVGSQTWNRLL